MAIYKIWFQKNGASKRVKLADKVEVNPSIEDRMTDEGRVRGMHEVLLKECGVKEAFLNAVEWDRWFVQVIPGMAVLLHCYNKPKPKGVWAAITGAKRDPNDFTTWFRFERLREDR